MLLYKDVSLSAWKEVKRNWTINYDRQIFLMIPSQVKPIILSCPGDVKPALSQKLESLSFFFPTQRFLVPNINLWETLLNLRFFNQWRLRQSRMHVTTNTRIANPWSFLTSWDAIPVSHKSSTSQPQCATEAWLYDKNPNMNNSKGSSRKRVIEMFYLRMIAGS